MLNNIRNFLIVAHVNHGKSTLADRFLELTQTVPANKMRPQYLDQMSLERELGITIKMQPVQMRYKIRNPKSEILNKLQAPNSKFQTGLEIRNSDLEIAGSEYILNLIDTPGHVDFSYEVSRALAAVEGVVLLVDAQKGIQAQTLSHLHLAQKQGLTTIPAVNKIDLPQARTIQVKKELATLLGVPSTEIFEVSAKTNQGVKSLLEAVIEKIPPPSFDEGRLSASSALVFDSLYDAFKGIVVHVRVFSGTFKKNDKIILLRGQIKTEILELGIFEPELKPQPELGAGFIGYIATGLKEPGLVKAGETISLLEDFQNKKSRPLGGYQEPQPVVFASFFPKDDSDFEKLKVALGKLKLNDASLTYEAERSLVLGRGFKVGFLGLLHLEIISERLRREFNLELVATTPLVVYKIITKQGKEETIYSPLQLPLGYQKILEPWAQLEIITPPQYLSSVTKLVDKNRGVVGETKYLGSDYLLLKAEAPLSEVIVNFFDQLKSVTSGFASMNYKVADFRAADLVKLDILVAGSLVDGLSRIVPAAKAYLEGKRFVKRLKELLPPEQFNVILQAAVDSKIIARETIKASRKDVTGYLYGGDYSRKAKLLQKQKKGKKELQARGKVRLPPSVFIKLMRVQA